LFKAIKSLTAAQYQALLTGLPTYCATTVFTIAGQSYTTTQVVALITSILNVKVAVAPAKATWLAATQAVDAAEAQDGLIVKGVRDVVALMFQNAPTTLAALAIVPRKPPTPLSAQARAAANAKAAATRLARGTASKKQKAEVTGNVTGVTITPVTAPSATPAATTPAAAPVVPAALASGSSTPHA
jgi:hypothetical protein